MAESSGYRVHLDSLRNLADELDKLQELTQEPERKLRSLGGDQMLPLGDFAEANALGALHAEFAEEMETLLGKVRAGVEFAARVTDRVADVYEELNARGVGRFNQVANAAAVPAYTGTAAPPAGSVAGPDVVAQFVVPLSESGTDSTLYYRDENGDLVSVKIKQDS
jgi:hypothetical protein